MSATTMADDRAEARESPLDTIVRAFDFDLSQPMAFAALAVAYVLARVPFINVGYGTDPDAWRVAMTGYWFWDHGEYYPSRLPGYPLHEYASSAVIQGGWLATNSLTLLISLLGVWFFAGVVRELKLPNRGLLVVGFAFTPLLFINSISTMDYMWALTFILGSYYLLLTGHYFSAGVVLGLAVASRSTSAIMLVPFGVYLWRDGRKDEIRQFVMSVLGVALLAYAPIIWRYGPGFLNFYDSKVGYLSVLRLLAKDCLGLIGAIGVLAALALSLPRLARLPGDFLRDKHVTFAVLAIAVVALSFTRLPHEAAYLIPLYPFAFLLMARYFKTWVLAGAIGAILLAGWVDLTSPGEEIQLGELAESRPGRGLVLSNHDTMTEQIRFSNDLYALSLQRDHTVVLTGFVYPQLVVLHRDELEIGIIEEDTDAISQLSDKGRADVKDRAITFVWLLDWDDFQEFRKGRSFLYTPDAGRSTGALYDYRPGVLYAEGAHLIDLGRGPSGGRGAARTDR